MVLEHAFVTVTRSPNLGWYLWLSLDTKPSEHEMLECHELNGLYNIGHFYRNYLPGIGQKNSRNCLRISCFSYRISGTSEL